MPDNLSKSIQYLKKAVKEEDLKNDKDLLQALDIMAKKELGKHDINDPNRYNTTDL